MLINNVKKIVSGGLGIAGIVALVVLVLCLVPMLALWTLNTLAELGGSSFYIKHSLFSYFVAFIAVALMNSGSSSK